eukprot:31239-Pelagomonas_calceolata.AAC.1
MILTTSRNGVAFNSLPQRGVAPAIVAPVGGTCRVHLRHELTARTSRVPGLVRSSMPGEHVYSG